MIQVRRKKFDAALPLLRTLHEVWPLDPMAAAALAEIHHTRAEYEAALPYLLVVARSETHNASAIRRIADCHEHASRLPDARYWYQQALHIDPLAEEPHLRLAEIAMRLGEAPAAVEEYRMLCRIAPHSAKYHADCALAYHKLGDAENTRSFAERAVKLDPNSPVKTLLVD
jgi:tetratricopeptide (TPR) repeat protein